MSIILTVKINNQNTETSSVRVLSDSPIISWDFDKLNSVIIDGSDGIIDDINIIQ